MAYETALSIISDAAAELGLGTVIDAYGSTDANIIQLRGLLKSGGRDIVRDRDWSHLIKEYSFTTRQAWAASTGSFQASPVARSSVYGGAASVGDFVTNAGNVYRCTTAGNIGASGTLGPITQESSITDNTSVWEFYNTGSSPVVVNGNYYYTVSSPVYPSAGGTTGTTGPYGRTVGGTETDGTVTWTCSGYASDYALPADFSNLIDQTGWNRTNRLPVDGPVDGQMWQYLKGRQQGVVFNVSFRPVAGVLRLYPDTDPTAEYNIVFEYVSSYWVSATGGTTPTTDAPTVNTDIIYFDGPLMVRRLKLDWLKAKGFDTTHAQREYDDELEEVMNADAPSPILNLSGQGPWDPLLGAQNIPPTGFGS